MLAAHRQFGQLSGTSSSYQRLLQKVTRRSLSWYTSSQHSLQGAIFRLFRDIAAILERHEIALLVMVTSRFIDALGGAVVAGPATR